MIDDGSTDESIEYIKYILKNQFIFKNIKFIKNKKNLGVGHSSKIAVEHSSGKYFMRVDSDDYINRFALDIMANILEYNNEYGYVYCDHFKTDNMGLKQKIVKLNTKKKKYAHGAGMLFRKRNIIQVGNYNKKFRQAEDHDLLMRLDRKTKSFYLPVPLYRYFIHDHNTTDNRRKKYINKIII